MIRSTWAETARFLALVPWLVFAGCASDSLGSADQTVPLRIDITSLPGSAFKLEPAVALLRQSNWHLGDGLGPIDLSRFPTRTNVSLDLVLPSEAASSDVAIAVRVQDQSDKLVALGSTSRRAYDRPHQAMAVLAVEDARTSTPMLVTAQPGGFRRTQNPEQLLFIYGWGFHPGARVQIDGQGQPVTWRSPALLEMTLVTSTLKGSSLTITVTNPDQKADTRSDLVVISD